MVFLTSVVIYVVFHILKVVVLKGRDPRSIAIEDVGFIQKEVIKKQESMVWDDFPSQAMMYLMQSLIFSFLQFQNLKFTTIPEIISMTCAISVLIIYPAFLFWLYSAQVKPTEDHLTVDKQREVFAQFKLEYKIMVLFTPLRKLVMAVVIVLLQDYPVW